MLYDEIKVALDRYLIVEPERTREVFNWFQFFAPETLSEELAEAGLATEAIVDAVTGAPWRDAAQMFAVIARRA